MSGSCEPGAVRCVNVLLVVVQAVVSAAVGGWEDAWKIHLTRRRVGGCVVRWRSGRMDGWRDGCQVGFLVGWMDRWMDGWADG